MKKHKNFATVRRLVALAMLCALLFSNSAVYAVTDNLQQEATEEGNSVNTEISNGGDSSTNSNTDSGAEITTNVENNSTDDVTDEATDDAVVEDDTQRTVTLELSDGEVPATVEDDALLDLESEEELDDEEAEEEDEISLEDMLAESKVEGSVCEHEELDDENVKYKAAEDGKNHIVKKQCKECKKYIEAGTEACEFSSEYKQIDGYKHQLVHTCTKCKNHYEDTEEECKSETLKYTKTDAEHHVASGTCTVCGNDFTKPAEECVWKPVEGNEKLQYCEHYDDGCLNIKDDRNKTPAIQVETALVKGDPKKDIEKIDYQGTVITAYDKAITITATVTVEALNDETIDDVKGVLNATLSLDGEVDQPMELKSFEKGKAVFFWQSLEQYDNNVNVNGLEVSYRLGEKLKDGTRLDSAKEGTASEPLNYILRNVNPDAEAKKLNGTVTDGAGWKFSEENPWYSKKVEGHKDSLLLTWTGRTNAAIDTNKVKLIEVDADGKEIANDAIKQITAKSEKTVGFTTKTVYVWGIKIDWPVYTVVYDNTIQYSVPAEDKGVDGLQRNYQLSFDILGKTHTKAPISTYIDNQAPTFATPDSPVKYTSEANRLNGKYYRKAVDVSVDFKDAHLSNESFIQVTDKIYDRDCDVDGKLSFNVKQDGDYTVTGKICDLAGNFVEINDEAKAFTIDQKAPVLKITFDNNEFQNEKYYKEDRTATFEVSDIHLKANVLESKLSNYIAKKTGKIEAEDIKEMKQVGNDANKYSGSIHFGNDGYYALKTVKVKEDDEFEEIDGFTDLAGNHALLDVKNSDKDYNKEFVIDKTAPVLKITFDNHNAKHNKYYKANRTATFELTDLHLNAEGASMKHVTVKESGGKSKKSEMTGTMEKFTGTILFDEDGRYSIPEVKAMSFKDMAGNDVVLDTKGTDPHYTDEFVIDKTAPVLKITFDNHDAKHEKYYKANRTATFELTDLHLDVDGANMKHVSVKQDGGKAKVSEMTGINGEDTDTMKKGIGTILFDEDGIYSIQSASDMKFEDMAGNTLKLDEKASDPKYNAEFVIDKTKPTVSIKFDNNSYQNDIYYKDPRVAEITFTEKNFSKDQVVLKKNSGDLNSIPALDGYKEDGTKHITKIHFEQDGRYGFEIACEDLAGNVSETAVANDFVIDRTAPELEITGVENMSANNGSVTPVIKSKDLNINDVSTEIVLSSANNGTVNPSISKTPGNGLFTYALGDLAHEKSNDDLYTLTAKLTDFAGNITEKKVTYSINRFGSVFVLSEGTKAMVDGYYVTNPQDVVITEINVDSLAKKEVSVAFDGSVKELREGHSYTTSDTTNSKGWHSISYTVPKSNFTKDGIYSVNIYSEDKATNKQSSQSKDAGVEFLLDGTAPSVIVSGLEDGGVYEEESHDFSVNAADTIGVTEMKVYLNDEKLASFDKSELNANGGTAVLTVPAADDYQKVTIECSDVAGNVTKLAYNNLLVSVKAEELLLEDNLTPTAKLDDETATEAIKKSISALGIVGIIAAVAVVSGLGVFAFRKKSK